MVISYLFLEFLEITFESHACHKDLLLIADPLVFYCHLKREIFQENSFGSMINNSLTSSLSALEERNVVFIAVSYPSAVKSWKRIIPQDYESKMKSNKWMMKERWDHCFIGILRDLSLTSGNYLCLILFESREISWELTLESSARSYQRLQTISSSKFWIIKN